MRYTSKLLHAHEVHVVDAPLQALLEEVRSRPFRSIGYTPDFVIGDQPDAISAELRVVPGNAVERGSLGDLVEPQRLWRRSDFGVIRIRQLAELAPELLPQNVEIVRWGGAVGDLHVVFSAHLQEALEAGRGQGS